MATTSQAWKKTIDGTDKLSSRKWKKLKFDMTGVMLDKTLIELEMKRALLEAKQKEMDIQIRREERDFQLQMMTANTQYSCCVTTRCFIIFHAFWLWVWWL